MDIEFERIRDQIKLINLETVATDDYVRYIEVFIRYVKQVIRSLIQSSTYERYTKLMITELDRYVLRKGN